MMAPADLYFPPGINSIDSSTVQWLSKYLLEMKEPNLYTNNNNDEVYRFTWVRSFDNPIVIRFEKHNNNYTLYAKEMINNEGYLPPELKVNRTKNMTAYEWMRLEDKIKELGFWNVPTKDPRPEPIDGAEWILEAIVKNKYHFIQRNSPTDKKYRACCKYLLSLTQLKIPEKDQY
jgi:hypothetical protein